MPRIKVIKSTKKGENYLIKDYSKISTLNDISAGYRQLFKDLSDEKIKLPKFREIRMALDGFSKNLEKQHMNDILNKVENSEKILEILSHKLK